MNKRNVSLMIMLATGYLMATSLDMKAQQLMSQGDPVELSIKEIGVADGLSQGMIHGMNVDLKGYLWIATKDGLNRYDGNHFHVFRHDPQDTTSIASNYIRSLHVDDHGLIWVGTNASGLDLYNPQKAEFIHFGSGSNANTHSRIQSVSRICSEPGGNVLIWDGTGEQCEVLVPIPGKDPFDPNAWTIKSLKEAYPLQPGISIPISNSMIGFSSDGALLFVDQQKLYALYAGHTKVLSQFKDHTHEPTGKNSIVFPKTYFMDDRHNIYVISSGESLMYRWDKQAGSFQAWIHLPQEFLKGYRFYVDHQDRIWSNGSLLPMYRIDPQQGLYQETTLTRYHYSGTAPTDFGIVCEDPQHNLWAATGGNGIIRISSRNDQFIRQYPMFKNSLHNHIAKNGTSFNIDDQFTIADDQLLRDRLLSIGLAANSAYAEDSLHQLWCLALGPKNQNYLVRINREDLSFTQQPIFVSRQMRYEYESSIMIDRAGIFWLGIECYGGEAQLIRLDKTVGVKDTFVFPVEVISNEHSFITDWYVDAQNVFWISTKQGFFSFNPVSGAWKSFHADPAHTDGLSNNHVLTICPDPKSPAEYLWLGTDGGGLNKLNITTGTFTHYSTKNGIPNNVIYAVQSDAHGNLWLSTNLGLCRFDPVKEEVWTFTIDDGLPGNEFNRMEFGKGSDGRLYFSGVEGAVSFDPEDFYSSTTASPIVINRLKLSNKEVTYGAYRNAEPDEVYHLSAPLENSQQLTFPYTERMITLGFSLLDFTNPSGNKYRYMLEGFNDEWIDAGELNEAVFTNLNPGTYKFMVSGCNSNNIWSEPASLLLIIHPPWWATWWFRIMMAVLLAAGIYGFYQYRLQQAMKIQHLRNRIAADLHDEIGSTLSSISLAGTVIQHKLKGQYREVDGLLNKINNNTQAMMEAMSDIVWAVNTRNDRFDQILHRMRAFAAEILEPKDIMVQFDVSPNLIPLQLDMQQRKNLYLIFKEVIHNAAKYAQCSHVWVNLNFTHGKLVMEVRDNGVGFDLDPMHANKLTGSAIETYSTGKGGNGIQNMFHRAVELKGKLEIQASSGQGTKITLEFAV